MAACRQRYKCGPIDLELICPGEDWRQRLEGVVAHYAVEWTERPLQLVVEVIRCSADTTRPATGNFLRCARFVADKTDLGVIATSMLGGWCEMDAEATYCRIFAPHGAENELMLDEVEQFITLALTLAWRRLGWIPLHAGAVSYGKFCSLICATSGGGKSTLVAALIRRGWQTLGDDKLLLRLDENGKPVITALTRHFNLHPRSSQWFPELGDMASLPPYSRWTEKRQVSIERVWPDRMRNTARPTHLIEVVRNRQACGMLISSVPKSQVLATLLRQVVIPEDQQFAREVLQTVAPTARSLSGVRLEIGENAYGSPEVLEPLERAAV